MMMKIVSDGLLFGRPTYGTDDVTRGCDTLFCRTRCIYSDSATKHSMLHHQYLLPFDIHKSLISMRTNCNQPPRPFYQPLDIRSPFSHLFRCPFIIFVITTFIFHHSFTISLQAKNLLVPQTFPPQAHPNPPGR